MCWIPRTTEQKLIKFVLYLYHEVQPTFIVLGDKIFLLAFNFRKPKRKWTKDTQISNQKLVLNDSFANYLTCYHAQIIIFFYHVDDLDAFQKLWKTLENAAFWMCDKTASESNLLMFYTVFQFVASCWTHVQQHRIAYWVLGTFSKNFVMFAFFFDW